MKGQDLCWIPPRLPWCHVTGPSWGTGEALEEAGRRRKSPWYCLEWCWQGIPWRRQDWPRRRWNEADMKMGWFQAWSAYRWQLCCSLLFCHSSKITCLSNPMSSLQTLLLSCKSSADNSKMPLKLLQSLFWVHVLGCPSSSSLVTPFQPSCLFMSRYVQCFRRDHPLQTMLGWERDPEPSKAEGSQDEAPQQAGQKEAAWAAVAERVPARRSTKQQLWHSRGTESFRLHARAGSARASVPGLPRQLAESHPHPLHPWGMSAKQRWCWTVLNGSSGGRSQFDAPSQILWWGYSAPQLRILSDYRTVLLLSPLETFSFNNAFARILQGSWVQAPLMEKW